MCRVWWMPIALVLIGGTIMAQDESRDGRADALRRTMGQLEPLHKPLGPPRPGDWLAVHREPGQSFDQYIRSRPTVPTSRRRVIYIQPLGDFSDGQRRVVALTAELTEDYFDLPTRMLESLPLSVIPARARRVHPVWKVDQVLTTYVLDELLRPKLPDDAFACIAFTASDLWPGRGWNFVFGQASLRERVGVWSLFRNGDPDAGDDEFRACLRRTAKTGVHELGHMFSILHCVAFECGMNGSNSEAEKDRRPLWLGPQCLAKVCWATGADPVRRYRRLLAFCDAHGLEEEADFYRRSLAALGHPATLPATAPAIGD